MEEENLKEQLIAATIELLREGKEKPTVRAISQKAGTGVGLINYHFQSKDKLINIAVQRMVDGIISQVPKKLEQMEGTQTDKLKSMVKLTLSYLAANPHIAARSILRDMEDGNKNDNTQTTIAAYDKILCPLVPDEDRRMIIDNTLCAALQYLFLRRQVLKKTTGFDFDNAEERSRYVDRLVDMIITE